MLLLIDRSDRIGTLARAIFFPYDVGDEDRETMTALVHECGPHRLTIDQERTSVLRTAHDRRDR